MTIPHHPSCNDDLLSDVPEPLPEPATKDLRLETVMGALADPLRMFQGQLPLFVEIYQIQVGFVPPLDERLSPIRWDSPSSTWACTRR